MSQTQVKEFEEDAARENPEKDYADALLLDIEGFEGPIDVLLELARNQKVDLSKVSILQLARQYLQFVDRAKERNLELAAEYLVMAAWLAYLKSRLLLPRDENSPEPSAEEMAEALQFQLRRLEAMQDVAAKLGERPQLGQDIHPRGMPEDFRARTTTKWNVALYDVLSAYGAIQRRQDNSIYDLPSFNLMSAEDAAARLTRMLGELPRDGKKTIWTTLEMFMPSGIEDRLYGCSALAATLTASLELAKQGQLEIRQDGLFRPIYVRGQSELVK